VDITREKAWELLTTYTKTQALQQHALAVELDDIIQETIAGMQKEAEAIGLKGTL